MAQQSPQTQQMTSLQGAESGMANQSESISTDDWNLYAPWYMGSSRGYHMQRDILATKRSALEHMIWNRILDGRPARFLEPTAPVHFAGGPLPFEIGEDTTAILNIGFGNGEWAFDVARSYRDVMVVGIDTRIPRDIVYPENLFTVRADFDAPFCHFDCGHLGRYALVHVRSVMQSVRSLPRFLGQCYDTTEPGGRVEIHEMGPVTSDDKSINGTALERLLCIQQGALGFYLGGSTLRALGGLVAEAGFVDVVVSRTRCPVNPETVSAGREDYLLNERERKEVDIGRLYRKQFVDVQNRDEIAQMAGWYPEQADALLDTVKRELYDPRMTAYSPVFVISARKPEYDRVIRRSAECEHHESRCPYRIARPSSLSYVLG